MGTIVKALLGILGAALVLGAAPSFAADLGNPGYTIGASGAAPRWDGVYFGLNLGGFMSPSSASSIVWYPPGLVTTGIPSSLSLSQAGAMGGAQVGFNKQWGGFVLGAEADFDFTGGSSASKSASADYFGTGVTVTQARSLDSLGTIRLKAGFAPIDDLLIYATGGLAFGQTHMSSSVQFANGLAFAGSSSTRAVGYAIGGGAEYAFDANWSVGAQFLYYDLGRSFVVGTANTPFMDQPDADTTAQFQGYALRLTLNYEFSDNLTASPVGYGSLPDSSEFQVSVGVRAGMSTGSSKLNLYDSTGSQLLSRLTYHDTQAGTAEFYARIDDRTGLYGKAYR